MFRVRSEQMAAFSKTLEDSFVHRVLSRLRDGFPQHLEAQGIREPDLEALVRRGMAESRKYKVNNAGDVERYIECMVVLGPSFDVDEKIPWAGQILRRDDVDGEAKMDQIDEYRIFGTDEPS
jgi:hypothetical protein